MTSNLVKGHVLWSYRPYQNLGQIDHNLHDHVFDDVICKPPIEKYSCAWTWTPSAKFVTEEIYPGDSGGIIKHHSNQYVRCWRQWRTDELVDVLCPSETYEKVFWWFLDLTQFASNGPRMLDKKFDN